MVVPAELLNAVTTGDARLLGRDVPDGSIDLIFTDPPYHREHLPLYGWLGVFAARVLKPSGFLLTYAGNAWKDEVMAMLRPHLTFFWDYIELMGGRSTMVWDRLTVARAKSILAYRLKGSITKPRTAALGLIDGSGKQKNGHQWQQNQETARYLIDCFVGPGAIVLDPFVGAGSTIAACNELGLTWVAFEQDFVTAMAARAVSGKA